MLFSMLALLAPLALLPGTAANDASLAAHARSGGATATLLVPAASLSYEALSRKYGVETLDAAGVAAYVAKHGLDRHVPPSGQAAAGASFLQVASKALAKVGVIANGCEICNYVMENKQMPQPFLCRGLKDPAQQQTVRIALPSTPPSFSVLPRFFHVYWLVIFFLFSCLYACSYPSLPPRPPRPSALIPITPTHPLPYPRSLIILTLILILSLSLRTRPVVR